MQESQRRLVKCSGFLKIITANCEYYAESYSIRPPITDYEVPLAPPFSTWEYRTYHRYFFINRSADQRPPPLMIRKILPKNMAQSVRLSCNAFQSPLSESRGALVVTRATDMIVNKGIAATLVNSPTKTNAPQTISKLPTNGPRKPGLGKPILAKRPAPRASANRNFCIPSERKTLPTIRRIRMVVFALSVWSIRSSIIKGQS